MRISLLIRKNTELADRDLLGFGFVLVAVACLFERFFWDFFSEIFVNWNFFCCTEGDQVYLLQGSSQSLCFVPHSDGQGWTQWDHCEGSPLNGPALELEAIGTHSIGAQKSSCCAAPGSWGSTCGVCRYIHVNHPGCSFLLRKPGLSLNLRQRGHRQVIEPMFKESQFISQFFYHICS